MTDLAIIGGTGLTKLQNLDNISQEIIDTPYGEPSGPITRGVLADNNIVFLPRHGYGHTIPPHKVNYRANMWALREAGAYRVISVAAVGGIRRDLDAAMLIIPDQIIDYTYSRISTYFEEDLSNVTHIDFTSPYSENLRQLIINAAKAAQINIAIGGTYAATQGPRLETAAEVDRLERDGCDIVGMTGMPEAALARELDIDYACCAVVANRAAGRGEAEITMQEIEKQLTTGMADVVKILNHLVKSI